MSPRCGIGSGGAEQFDDLHRIGAMLGGEVVKTWAEIRTHNQHGPRRIVQSVAAISVRDYEPLPEASLEHFNVATQRVTLPMGPLLSGWLERVDETPFGPNVIHLSVGRGALSAATIRSLRLVGSTGSSMRWARA